MHRGEVIITKSHLYDDELVARHSVTKEVLCTGRKKDVWKWCCANFFVPMDFTKGRLQE